MRFPSTRRTVSPSVHDERRRERRIARLVRAAAAVDTSDAVALAEEALPLDNEALALAEGSDPAAESPEGGGES